MPLATIERDARCLLQPAVVVAIAVTTLLAVSGVARADPDDGEIMDRGYSNAAARVPEFAGLYVDGRGVVHLMLTDPSPQVIARAREALDEHMGDLWSVDVSTAEIVAVRVKYSYGDLLRWHTDLIPRVRELTGGAGGDFVSDSVAGGSEAKIAIGITNAGSYREAIEAELDRLGVPRDAVLVHEQDPILPMPGTDRTRLYVLVSLGAVGALAAAIPLWRNVRKSRVG